MESDEMDHDKRSGDNSQDNPHYQIALQPIRGQGVKCLTNQRPGLHKSDTVVIQLWRSQDHQICIWESLSKVKFILWDCNVKYVKKKKIRSLFYRSSKNRNFFQKSLDNSPGGWGPLGVLPWIFFIITAREACNHLHHHYQNHYHNDHTDIVFSDYRCIVHVLYLVN